MNTNNKIWWILGGTGLAITCGWAVYHFLLKSPQSMHPKEREPQPNPRPTSGSIHTSSKPKPAGNTSPSSPTKPALTEPNWGDPFDMHYEQDVQRWVAPQALVSISSEEANAWAKSLHEAKGSNWWKSDQTDTVENIFGKQLRNKVQVAQLSRAFWDRYQLDLWQYLDSFLNDREMESYVQDPVRNLPNYQLA